MVNRPSYLNSTFSLVTIIISAGFTILCVWQKDVSALKDVTLLVLGAYGATKGIQKMKGTDDA